MQHLLWFCLFVYLFAFAFLLWLSKYFISLDLSKFLFFLEQKKVCSQVLLIVREDQSWIALNTV